LLQVRGLQLVFTVCGSNQSALRQTQQFLAEFDALAQELSKAELAAQPFLQAFKARARRQFFPSVSFSASDPDPDSISSVYILTWVYLRDDFR
jgi:hypothetical protein